MEKIKRDLANATAKMTIGFTVLVMNFSLWLGVIYNA